MSSTRMWERLVSGIARPFVTVSVTVALAGCVGTAAENARAPSASRTAPVRGPFALEQGAMQADLDEWLSVLEEVHPDPYTKIDRAAFRARAHSARSELVDGLDPLEFYAVMQRLAARLGDSHTYFLLPRESRAYADRRWTVKTRVDDGRLVVREPEGELSKGTELVEINGHSVKALLADARSLSSAELPEGVDLRVPDELGVALWLEGVRAPFRVVGRSAAGANVSAVLGGEPALSTQPSHGGKAYDFRWLPENVAYIAILKMDDVEGFESFSAEAFAEIDKKRARGLVVDLRFDDGGNTDVGDLLLARITEKSYRMVSEKHWLVSERYRAVARRHYDGTSAYFSARPGTLLRFRMDAQPPLERSPRYRGPVCFLVGPGTTSSGMMLANAVEDYELATLIGEPTASPPNYFGETLHFSLSKTKLEGIASVARFVRANGDASSVAPVRPDIAVEPTLEEWLRGDDPVLKRALDWIRIGR